MKTAGLFKFLFSIVGLTIFLNTNVQVFAADPTQMQYYIDKYHFANSTTVQPIDDSKKKQLEFLAPYFGKAVTAFNKRYKATMDPQLVMWWTASEGTQEQTHSNCANVDMVLHNCKANPTFWQLGPAGIQFKFLGYYGSDANPMPLLKAAFTDMKGDPNDANLVQKTGQAVLDYDKIHKNPVDPVCGGMSCAFPSLTIDQIYKDVHCGASPCNGGTPTDSNWWASVLTRDPEIGAYIQARGLDHMIEGCYGIRDASYCSGPGPGSAFKPRLNNWMNTILSLKLSYNGQTTGTTPDSPTQLGEDTINVIPNFKDKYQDYYNWAKDNLFDGLEFYKGNNQGTGADSGNSTDLVEYTKKIRDALIKACPPGNSSTITGHVNGASGGPGCMELLRISKGGAFEDAVINTYQSMPLQCIMFIYGITQHKPFKSIALRNAVDEAGQQTGYDWHLASEGLSNVKPGDFFVWHNGVFGHFGEALKTDTVADTVTIIDANWDGNGSITTHTEAWKGWMSDNLTGWQRMQGQVTIGGGTTGGTTGGPVPGSNKNTCNNTYTLNNPRGMNFGDPNCDFKKEDLSAYLQKIDPANASNWYSVIAICESGYNPNAYASPATGTPDAGGAWGLFQMGQGKNGQYDHGDVYWRTQADGAVNYRNKVINGSWAYWGTRNGCAANGNQGVK